VIRRTVLALLFIICCFAFANPLHAQTADRIERLLEQKTVSYQEAALLALEASGHLDPAAYTKAGDAFGFARERGWLPANAEAGDAVNLKGLSLLVTRAFGIKGGLFYAIFKNSHYAYRTLVHYNIIQGRADPLMYVTGELLLFTVNSAMYLYGSGE
jgi:hypothetical protein